MEYQEWIFFLQLCWGPFSFTQVSVSCGIDAGEICQLVLGRLHPQASCQPMSTVTAWVRKLHL